MMKRAKRVEIARIARVAFRTRGKQARVETVAFPAEWSRSEMLAYVRTCHPRETVRIIEWHDVPPAPTNVRATPSEGPSARATDVTESRPTTPAPTIAPTAPIRAPSARAFDFRALRDLANIYSDTQGLRVQTGNRVDARRRAGEAPHLHEEEMLLALKGAEHFAALDLKRIWRTHPLAAWGKTQVGLREGVLLARLIAEIGEPHIGSRGHFEVADVVKPDGRTVKHRTWIVDEYFERTVSQLWAYCCFDPNRMHPPKGASQAELMACGDRQAQVACYRIAQQLKRTVGHTMPNDAASPRSPYRDVYEERKAYELERGLPKGHAENRALRFVAKRFLKDLWRASRAVHSRLEAQVNDDAPAAPEGT